MISEAQHREILEDLPRLGCFLSHLMTESLKSCFEGLYSWSVVLRFPSCSAITSKPSQEATGSSLSSELLEITDQSDIVGRLDI